MATDWLSQYTAVRLHRGKLCAVHKFMFTWGLLVGLSEEGYEHRYCYGERMEAMDALDTWADEEHPPGRWIKRKGLVGGPELDGPGAKRRHHGT